MKSDLKKASADTAKLKKKASKKIGKQEYTDQFRDSMKVQIILIQLNDISLFSSRNLYLQLFHFLFLGNTVKCQIFKSIHFLFKYVFFF